MIIALSGGIGGAKLALGLSRVLPPEELLIIANTGDDFEHYGLTICPDTDTLLYTLAGLDNPRMKAGLSWKPWQRLAGRIGFASAIVIWRCMCSAAIACVRVTRFPPSRMISVSASALARASCR